MTDTTTQPIWQPSVPVEPEIAPVVLTADQVIAAIRRRYTPEGQVPEWVVIEQVRNQQGFGGRDPIRTFDALMVGLWESRGHPVHGFEVKVSKGDWKRELKAPDKADPLVRHVSYWWIAAPAGVVDPSTLPEGWGLQVTDGKRLRTVREATKREPLPPSWSMVAAIMKRAAEQVTDEAARRAEYERGRKAGRTEAEESHAVRRVADERDRLREVIARFEQASGLDLPTWSAEHAEKLGAAVRTVMGDHGSPMRLIQQARSAAQRFLEETAP
jgi:hypothetical protein